jgi:peptide/nickel transport system permease protein
MTYATLPVVAQPSRLRHFVQGYADSKIAVAALLVLMLVLLSALLAPWVSPQNPYDLAHINVMDARLAPGTVSALSGMQHYLGTDEQGRDLLSAIIYGLRISLFVGFTATAIALSIGAVLGMTAGYYGGRVESFIMRLADIQLSFPAILIALILIAVLGQGVGKVIAALVAVQWAYYARTARGAALVEVATLQIAAAIALEATLSFLGLGLPITEPSLGLLIANGFQFMMSGKYWMSTFPGIALVITIVAINLVADQLRDVLNPRLQGA